MTPGSCAWCGGPMDPAPPDQCPPYCSAECRRERHDQACDHGHATAREYLPCWQRATWPGSLVSISDLGGFTTAHSALSEDALRAAMKRVRDDVGMPAHQHLVSPADFAAGRVAAEAGTGPYWAACADCGSVLDLASYTTAPTPEAN